MPATREEGAMTTTTSDSDAIVVSEQTLLRDGAPMRLYSGEINYWRIERADWERVLDSLVDTHATAVTLYMPWEAHEIEPGRFDFGEIDPRLDVDAFMTMAGNRGLDIIARPGPQINAEMTWFGYPRRLLERDDLHMRNAAGGRTVLTQVPKPIPALSYANEDFFTEAASWLDAICAILVRHAHPRGRLVAAQVDNEMAYFFNVNAWAADFSDASLEQYREFLADKYADVATLNAVYGTTHQSFAAIDAPRRYSGTGTVDIPRLSDWSEYREHYLVRSVGRLATMMRERGLTTIPLFHNYPHPLNPGSAASGFTTPFDLMGLEREVDFVGFDMYSRKQLYDHVKTVVSYVAGSSRFPFAPELIGGSWPWYQQPGDPADEEFVVKAAVMHGLKGFSRYMMVERDRWLGSPIRRDGEPYEAGADVARSANDLVAENAFADLRRHADVLLLADRDYDRLAASSVLVSFPGDFLESPTGFSEYPNDLTVSEDSLGLAQPVQFEKSHRFTAYYQALTAADVSFLLSDTTIDPQRWSNYAAVVLSTYEYLNAKVQRAAVDFASAGGTVIIGPLVPDRDERLQPDTTLRDALGDDAGGGEFPVGSGRVVLLGQDPDTERVVSALAPLGLTCPSAGQGLDVVVHDDVKDDRHRVVFVANPTDTERDALVDLGEPVTEVIDLWQGHKRGVDNGRFPDRLPPRSIAVYSCTLES